MLPELADRFPPGIYDLLLVSLALDRRSRPSLQAFEQTLWGTLEATDPKTQEGLRMQIENIEDLARPDSQWPHMEEMLSQLRTWFESLTMAARHARFRPVRQGAGSTLSFPATSAGGTPLTSGDPRRHHVPSLWHRIFRRFFPWVWASIVLLLVSGYSMMNFL